jgi:hypothetical protein
MPIIDELLVCAEEELLVICAGDEEVFDDDFDGLAIAVS